MSERNMTMVVACRLCREPQAFDVNGEDWARWKGGEYVQVAFPYLDAGEREMLVSATCDRCWHKTFGEWDD